MENMSTIAPKREHATVKERPELRIGQIARVEEISKGIELICMIEDREVRQVVTRNNSFDWLGETKVDSTVKSEGPDFIEILSLSDWGVTQDRNGLWSEHKWLKDPQMV